MQSLGDVRDSHSLSQRVADGEVHVVANYPREQTDTDIGLGTRHGAQRRFVAYHQRRTPRQYNLPLFQLGE